MQIRHQYPVRQRTQAGISRAIIDFKYRRISSVFTITLIFAGALAFNGRPPSFHFEQALLAAQPQTSTPQPESRYEVRADHDPNGTGKFYMGREIAQVMGFGGIDWLDRPERQEQEHPDVVLKALSLQPGDVVADLGAGSGYFTFRMANAVGQAGKVLAVDIQDEMLATLRQRAAAMGISNVVATKASETDPHLPAGGVKLVLVVDVYHELSYPYEVMTKVREALEPGGRVVFVEYRKEDPSVPIKELHKMSVEQLTREMNAVGLERVKIVEALPLQHIVIFEKKR